MRHSANLGIAQKHGRHRRRHAPERLLRQHLRVSSAAPAPELLQVRIVPTVARARNLVPQHIANEDPNRKTKDQNSIDRHVVHAKCPPKLPRFARQPSSRAFLSTAVRATGPARDLTQRPGLSPLPTILSGALPKSGAKLALVRGRNADTRGR